MMVQIYFLSIVFNGLTGFLFLLGDFGEKSSAETSAKFSPVGTGFRLILGILAAVTGVLKLLIPYEGIPILGDLIPSAAGMIAGFMLIYGFYRERSSNNVDHEGKINHFGEIALHYKKAAGIMLLAIAALHFFFPKAFLL